MDRVFELLTELSIDPFKQDAFARDPEAVLAAAGLTPEEREALARWSRRPAGTRCAFFADPGPDPFPDPDLPEPEDLQA